MLMPGYELRANSLILLALVKHLEYGKRPLELLYILLANASILFDLIMSACGNSLIKLREVSPYISFDLKHSVYSGNVLAIICLNLFLCSNNILS